MNLGADDRPLGSVLRNLSRQPGVSPAERFRYHGARLALPAALALLVTFLFPPTDGTQVTPYDVGVVAPADVIAEIGFAVSKTAAELERDRRQAAEAVPRTFDEHPAVGDSIAASLGIFFDMIDRAVVEGDTLGVDQILRSERINASPSQMAYVLDSQQRNALRTASRSATLEIIPRGMADPAEAAGVTTDVIYVRTIAGDNVIERTRPLIEVITSRDFYAQAVLYLPPGSPPDAQDLLRLVLISHLQFSLIPNVIATEAAREAARNSVPLTKADVLRGEAIVRAADPIGPETLERLQAYENALRDADILESEEPLAAAVLGGVSVTLMLLLIFGLLVFFSRPRVYANFRWLLLLTLLSAAYFLVALAIHEGGLSSSLLPIPFVALSVAVLWDTRMSLLLVLVLAAITGTLSPFSDYTTVLVLMIAGAAAAMSVRAVRRRSETWVSIAIISGAASLALFSQGFATATPLLDTAWAALFVSGNAVVCAFLAAGFLWVFELFTGITTDQTLLEWADPNRPLLRRLSMEAPGTYAHTINVSNLAEAAANEIGANGLLCRVGVLYHDVGKMLKPRYFVENQHDGRNPHDKLKAEMSASIIREHVTEGVRLAREEKVPDVVLQFILEHHGTQKIGFFYEKAREDQGPDIDPDQFTYPGPKPRSKETALVMLADSVESAARAMREPTPERVRDLIDMVVGGKISDGQLDEAPLTLSDVTRAKHQFVKILGGVVHRRIEYPETRHLTEVDGGPSTNDSAGARESSESI